jgi:hypothetical protein
MTGRLNKLNIKRVNTEAEVEHAQAELMDAEKRYKSHTLPPGAGVTIDIAGRTYQFDDLQGHVRGWRGALKAEKQALRNINVAIAGGRRND